MQESSTVTKNPSSSSSSKSFKERIAAGPPATLSAAVSPEKTTAQTNGSASPKPRNDNSNPQQGTGVVSEGANPPSGASTPTTAVTESSAAAHETAVAGAAPAEPPVIVNPTPNRVSHHGRPSLKIPPTKKDPRKLFIGGLPPDSKYRSCA